MRKSPEGLEMQIDNMQESTQMFQATLICHSKGNSNLRVAARLAGQVVHPLELWRHGLAHRSSPSTHP